MTLLAIIRHFGIIFSDHIGTYVIVRFMSQATAASIIAPDARSNNNHVI